MQCPKCHQWVPQGAQFCMRCGTAVPVSMPVSYPAANPKMKWIAVAIGILLLAAVAFVAGRQAGLFTQSKSRTPSGPNVLQAHASNVQGPNMLQVPSTTPGGPNMLQNPMEKDKPQESAPSEPLPDWLEHLRRIEMKRRAMRNDFSPALDMLKTALTMKTELEDDQMQEKQRSLEGGYEKYAQNWYALLTEYRSVPPPPSCKVLADTYDIALKNYIEIMLDLQKSLQNQDVSGLMKMRGTAQGNVDQQLIQADMELSKLFAHYNARKYFDIQPDTKLDSLFGLGF